MIIGKLRLQRGWSQSQLAEMAGMSSRTVQRIEQGRRPSLETCKALASVFEVDLSIMRPEKLTMNSDTILKADKQEAMLYAKRIKEFYGFLLTCLILAIVFLIVFSGESTVYLIFAGLGVAVIIPGLVAFEIISFLGSNWEKRLVEKNPGRKL